MTTCCHRPDCADTNCPGRTDRPPHTAVLQSTNSDGSAAGYSLSAHDTPALGFATDWIDELRYWVVVCIFMLACFAGTALFAGYLFNR